MRDVVTVTLPDIGEGVVEGEVVEWLKAEGDPLAQDEPVVVVMTDKATVELPSPYVGILKKQHFQPGEIAKKDGPLYDVEVEQAPIPSVNVKRPPPPPKKEAPKKQAEGVLATPATRQLAKDLGVKIDEIPGSGQKGRVTDRDVVLFHAKPRVKTPTLEFKDDETVPVVGIPHRMAERMAESKTVVPHFSFFDQADAARLIQLKNNSQSKAKEEGVDLTYMPFFIKALSHAINENPKVNSSIDPDCRELRLHRHHNIGVASHTEQGLIVFVLRDVQKKSLEEVIREYHRLIEKKNKGQLKREEMIESTITISNFGPLGGRWATPIINYPEVAILGVAKIQNEAVVINDEVVARPRLNLSWSFDHRVVDGAAAAKMSRDMVALLENPARLL